MALPVLPGVRGAYSERGEMLSDRVSTVGDISEVKGEGGVAFFRSFVEIKGVAF